MGWTFPQTSPSTGHDEIQRQLPDFVDLLVVAVEAGLGIDAALSAVAEVLPSPLGDHCRQIDREVRGGANPGQAWTQLSLVFNSPEFGDFMTSVFLARQAGVGIGESLRQKAELVREIRVQKAREAAGKLPTQMVFANVFLVPLMIVELLALLLLPTFFMLLLMVIPGAAVLAVRKRAAAFKEQAQLERQLGDTVAFLGAAVRTGQSPDAAFRFAVDSTSDPLHAELVDLLAMQQSGATIEQICAEIAQRLPGRETRFLSASVRLQQRAGTQLGPLLDRVSQLIRQRVRIRGEIAALTAQARFSAVILTATPLILGMVAKVIHISLAAVFPVSFGVGVLVFCGVLFIFACQGLVHYVIDRMLDGVRKFMP